VYLKKQAVLAMKPGRELDALVAEKVMGWRKKTFPGGGGGFTAWVDENEKVMKLISNSTMSETCYRCDYFRPSTDIVAALEVAIHLQKQGYYVCIDLKACEETSVGVYEADPANQIAYAKAQTPAEAICKAALLAVMDG